LTHNNTSPTSRADSEQVVKGIIALVIATLFFAAQDAITKHLTQSISVAQIVSVRFFFFSLFALIFAARKVGIKVVFHSSRLVKSIDPCYYLG
jgi:drug/metabolite transporter (DMT)-like permease